MHQTFDILLKAGLQNNVRLTLVCSTKNVANPFSNYINMFQNYIVHTKDFISSYINYSRYNLKDNQKFYHITNQNLNKFSAEF